MSMDMNEKIEMLETISEETDTDILTSYLRLAEEKIINRAYPYGITTRAVPEAYETLQIELANVMLAKRGAEGESSHDENGVKRVYSDEEELLNSIVPMGSVIV